MLQAVFWEQGTLPPTDDTIGLSVPSGMLVMSKLDESSGLLALTICDPWGTRAGASTTTISLSGIFTGTNCSGSLETSGGDSTDFVFGELGSGNLQGQSATVVCTRPEHA